MRIKSIQLLFLFVAMLFAANGVAAQQKYNEAPVLKEMVKRGLIPPVEKRLPDHPVVIKPLHEIGRYGGSIQVFNGELASRAPTALYLQGQQLPFKTTTDGKPGVPNIFESYEVNSDFTVWTFHLRKGLKWSDGYPFTAENQLLYWKYDRADPKINPSISQKNILDVGDKYVVFYNENGDGRTVKKEEVDDYTIRYTCKEPYPILINRMSHYSYTGEDVLVAMHFMKQFLPAFIGEAAAEKKAKDAGFNTWYEMYEWFSPRGGDVQSTQQINGNFPPSMQPYVLVKKTTTMRVWERNPFFYQVDTAGNQLPYIDRIINTNVEGIEMVNGKIITGAADAELLMQRTNFIPLYKQYETQAGYKTIIWNFAYDINIIYINYNYEDATVSNLFRAKDFRLALQLAVPRQRIINEICFGQGKPIRFSVLPETMFYKPEQATKNAEYDPERSKKLLANLGLADTNNDGWLEDAKGNKVSWVIEWIDAEGPKKQITEMVADSWRKLGINVVTKQDEPSLGFERTNSNQMAMWVWNGDNRDETLFENGAGPFMPGTWVGTWYRWWTTKGSGGEEPPQEVKQIYQWQDNMRTSVSKDDMKKWGQMILDSYADNCWNIDTVSDIPEPTIWKNDFRNIPEKPGPDGPMYWFWATHFTNSYDPAQFYLANRPPVSFDDSLLPNMYPVSKLIQDAVERAKKEGWL